LFLLLLSLSCYICLVTFVLYTLNRFFNFESPLIVTIFRKRHSVIQSSFLCLSFSLFNSGKQQGRFNDLLCTLYHLYFLLKSTQCLAGIYIAIWYGEARWPVSPFSHPRETAPVLSIIRRSFDSYSQLMPNSIAFAIFEYETLMKVERLPSEKWVIWTNRCRNYRDWFDINKMSHFSLRFSPIQ